MQIELHIITACVLILAYEPVIRWLRSFQASQEESEHLAKMARLHDERERERQ